MIRKAEWSHPNLEESRPLDNTQVVSKRGGILYVP
jgi:hypothetical protein